MIQTIEIDEADGIGSFGGVPEDHYAGEVFIGGTKARPLVITYECDDSGESGPDWQVDHITLFHPDGGEEQIEWNVLVERMSYAEVVKVTEHVCNVVDDDINGRYEQGEELDVRDQIARERELMEDATRESNP